MIIIDKRLIYFARVFASVLIFCEGLCYDDQESWFYKMQFVLTLIFMAYVWLYTGQRMNACEEVGSMVLFVLLFVWFVIPLNQQTSEWCNIVHMGSFFEAIYVLLTFTAQLTENNNDMEF